MHFVITHEKPCYFIEKYLFYFFVSGLVLLLTMLLNAYGNHLWKAFCHFIE